MRILYVSLADRMAGAEHSLLLLLRHLLGDVEPVVAGPADSDLLARCRAEGVPCVPGPTLAGRQAWTARRCLEAARWVRRAAGKVRPDIIHANNVHAMVVCGLAGTGSGAQLVWHARDVPRRRLLTRWCAGRARGIVAVSQGVRDRLVGRGATPAKVQVVYNGVDPVPGGALAARGHDTPFTFACVGQFVRWKQQDRFLAAARIARQHVSQSRFLLVGSDVFGRGDSYAAVLRAMIERHRMSQVERISWQRDMEPIWQRTDCLVHVAREEPFGRVLIEAMVRSRPVVAFASGGPTEIVLNERTGFLVPLDDVSALAKAMVRLARDRSLAAALGRAGRRRALEAFSAQSTARGVLSMYRKTLNDC